MERTSLSPLACFVMVVAVALLYWGAASIGLAYATIHPHVPDIYLQTGIAIAAVLRFGPWALLSVGVGAFAAHMVAQPGALGLSFVIAAGHTLEAFVALKIVEDASRWEPRVGPYTLSFATIVAAACGAACAATIGSGSLWVFSTLPSADFGRIWLTWWMGGFTTILVVVPLVMAIAAQEMDGAPQVSLKRAVPGLTIAGVVTAFVLGTDTDHLAVSFALLPVVAWASLRTRATFATLMIIVMYAAAIVLTIMGRGPFHVPHGSGGMNVCLIDLQIIFATLAMTSLVCQSLRAQSVSSLALAALALAWPVAAGVAHILENAQLKQDELTFQALIADAEARLQNRLATYEDALRAAATLFRSWDDVSRSKWDNFVESLDLLGRYPGASGLGLVERVSASGVDPYQKAARAEGDRDFAVIPLHGKQSIGDVRHVVRFIHPRPENGQIVEGVDVASEGTRREAFDLALAQGRPVLSGSVRVLEEVDGPLAYLLVAPIQRAERPGWIFAAFFAESFFEKALGHSSALSSPTIFEGDSTTGTLVYGEVRPFQVVSQVDLGGRLFTIGWSHGPEFHTSRDQAAMAVGALISLLGLIVSGMVASLESIRTRAALLADRMTAERIERERLWEALMEAAPVGIFLSDEHGAVTYVNRRYTELSGMTLAEAREKGLLHGVHPEDAGGVQKAWSLLMAGEAFHAQFRYLKRHPLTQTETWVTVQVIPRRDEVEHVIGYVGSVQDISEIKRQQRDLIASSKMSSLGEMAGGIAHEINNPLMVIQALADRILRQGPDADGNPKSLRDIAEQIIDTVRRIARIVYGLRVFARDADKDPFVEVTIGSIIEATLGLCQERFRNQRIALNVEGDLTQTLRCRPVQISQVLLNLLSNAYDAVENRAQRWVRVDVSGDAAVLRIAVTDNGEGIPEHVASKIMQPFFTTKPVGKGTGLGLSIARGLVADHGGELVLDQSAPQTRFVLTLRRDPGADRDS